MKKFLLLLHLLFILSVSVYSDEIKEPEDEFPGETKETFYMEKRMFEFGFLNFGLGVSNSFLSAGEIFREKIAVDINKLEDGLRFNLDASVSPFFLDINYLDKWGIGFSMETAAMGVVNLSGKMLALNEISGDKSDVSAAVFSEARLKGFFHIGRIKLLIKPAVYYPLVYIKPDISYTYQNTDNGTSSDTVLNVNINLFIYTAVSMEDFSGDIDVTASPGADINLGFEYPLSEVIGLSSKLPFLDFDIGLELFNIPLVPSVMRNYLLISARIGGEEPLNLFSGDVDLDSFLTIDDSVYGEEDMFVFRPFKLLTWAHWRPFKRQPLTIIPSLGFAVNPLYHKPFSMEGGVTARLDLANIFITEFGNNYTDRVWKNSLDFALNTRAVEFNFGLSMQSAKFLKSWTAAGFGMKMGIKFGW